MHLTRRATRLARTRFAAFTILAAALVICVAPFYPGRMNADTWSELGQAAAGRYTDRHAPVLQWLWHPFFDLGVGPGHVLVLQVGLFLTGSYLILRLALARVPAAAGASVIAVLPQAFGQLALVGRDAWFVAAVVMLFGALARTTKTTGRARLAWFATAAVFAWLALAARQNAAAAVVVAVVLAVGLWRSPLGPRPDPRFIVSSIAIGVLLTLGAMGSQSLLKQAIGVQPEYPSAPLYAYDLAAMGHDDGKVYIPRTALDGRPPGAVLAHFNVDDSMSLIVSQGAPMPGMLTTGPETPKALRQAWVDRLRADPLGWLTVRGRVYLRAVGVTRRALYTYEPNIVPPGYKTEFVRANEKARDYLALFHDAQYNGNFVYSVWVYLLGCVVAAVILLRRFTWPSLVLAGVALAALTYQLGLFFGLMSVGYRFEFPAVVLAEIVAVAGVGALVRTPAVQHRLTRIGAR